jgi:hypothetical protein
MQKVSISWEENNHNLQNIYNINFEYKNNQMDVFEILQQYIMNNNEICNLNLEEQFYFGFLTLITADKKFENVYEDKFNKICNDKLSVGDTNIIESIKYNTFNKTAKSTNNNFLSIPLVNKNRSITHLRDCISDSLQSSYDHYFYDIKNPTKFICKQKCLKIYSFDENYLPNFLCFSLVRFKFMDNIFTKIKIHVNISEEIKLNDLNIINNQNNDNIYKVVYIIFHIGETVNSGHYISLAYLDEIYATGWYTFNDNIVTKNPSLSLDEIILDLEKQDFFPYIVFYKLSNKIIITSINETNTININQNQNITKNMADATSNINNMHWRNYNTVLNYRFLSFNNITLITLHNYFDEIDKLDDIIIQKFRIPISVKTIHRLNQGEWLNDEVNL